MSAAVRKLPGVPFYKLAGILLRQHYDGFDYRRHKKIVVSGQEIAEQLTQLAISGGHYKRDSDGAVAFYAAGQRQRFVEFYPDTARATP